MGTVGQHTLYQSDSLKSTAILVRILSMEALDGLAMEKIRAI